jgi:hypothetical protein
LVPIRPPPLAFVHEESEQESLFRFHGTFFLALRTIGTFPISLLCGHQCRGPFLSYVTRAIGESFGGSSVPPQGLHSHGMPAPQSHASARWLWPRQAKERLIRCTVVAFRFAFILLIGVVSNERPVPLRYHQLVPLQHSQKPCGLLPRLQLSLPFFRRRLPRGGS